MIDEKAKEALIDQTGRMVACGWRGNPHMSGDDRNFMQGSHRRRFDDRVRAAVEFVLSAAYESAKQKGEAEGWRPIESAPKDGRKVLACWAGRTNNMMIVWYEDETWQALIGGWQAVSIDEAPTHWRPLPEPPTMLSAGGEG